MQPPSSAPVRAAGGVVWQPGAGEPSLALVRDHDGGWRLPADLVGPGETEVEAAVRATRELLGRHGALGPFLGVTRGRSPEGALTLTGHWAVRAPDSGDEDASDAEVAVGGIAWLPGARALETVREADRSAVTRFLDGPAHVARVLLLRHCEAEQWRDGDDALRPLTAPGRDRAARLAGVVAALGVTELVTSPARRCVETLAPAASALGLPVTEESILGEQGTDRDKAARILRERAGETGAVLVCTHAPLIGALLERFAAERPQLLPRPARLDAGGAWCAEFGPHGLSGLSYLAPPPLPGASR